MKGIVKWVIKNILGNTGYILVAVAVVVAVILFLIPVRVCQGEETTPSRHQIFQGEDTIHIPNHQTQIQFHRDSSLGKQDHGENPLAQNGPKEMQYRYAFSYGLWVHHYTSEAANEGIENRLLAFEYKNIVVSYFDNSYNKDTVFLGYAFHTDKLHSRDYKDWWVRGNFYLGGLVGYGDKNPCNYHGLGLGAYPTGSLGYKQTSIEMGVMPTFVWWALKYEF